MSEARKLSTEPGWAAKAHALDVYRWRLLRERYGVLGSALRFLRDACVDLGFGLQAKRRLAVAVQPAPCDILLLQSSFKVIKLRRKGLLTAALEARGYRLVETALPAFREICTGRQLRKPPQRLPLRYFGYAAHAEWLVERHGPKVLLNDRNGSLYSPFLRLSLGLRRATLVHLAHATTAESSRRLGMNDYDYYFLFGQSSLAALKQRRLRFGESIAVLSGSHMIDRAYDLPSADPLKRTLLVLGVGPDKEKECGYRNTYALIQQWAELNPEYRVLIKRHPRSQVPFWQQAALALSNVQVLPGECTLSDALKEASLVVNIMSNAVIEAALAGRPVLFVNTSGDDDIFDQERFFGPRLVSLEGVQARVHSLQQDYAAGVAAARAFAQFHLAHGSQGLDATLAALDALLTDAAPARLEGEVLAATI